MKHIGADPSTVYEPGETDEHPIAHGVRPAAAADGLGPSGWPVDEYPLDELRPERNRERAAEPFPLAVRLSPKANGWTPVQEAA